MPHYAGRMAIRIKPSHKGNLHKALGVPESQPIPAHTIDAALRTGSPLVRKMATFAKNAQSFHHGSR